MKLSKETVLLSDIVNYSLKGLTSALGKGGGITKNLFAIKLHVGEQDTIEKFVASILATQLIEDADAIVVPSKVVAILENRFVYGLTINNYRKCVENIKFAKKHLKTADGTSLRDVDLVGLDKIDPSRQIGSRYSDNPNQSAHRIAKEIKKQSHINIDVVISDSDSGGARGIKLIGCPTVISTPIGATNGLRLFYCMRLSVAAEATWNNIMDTPVVVVKPYQEYRLRDGIGAFRYSGFLQANKEADVIAIVGDKQ